MQRRDVKSKMVRSIGYDPATKKMEVTFASGPRYQFDEVPQPVFDEFCACDSFGRFFNTRIKGHYKHTRLDVEQES